MATPGALQPRIRDIVAAGGVVPGGIIPLRDTIFTWQSLASVAIEIARRRGGRGGVHASGGAGERRRRRSGSSSSPSSVEAPRARPVAARPGSGSSTRRRSTWRSSSLGAAYLALYVARAKDGLSAINVNTINLAFLMLGVLLHGTPARLMRAVREATPATWGVILQFPFYAGIAGMITETALNERIARVFVGLSSRARRSRRSSRRTRRCSASSCRRAGRSGSSRRRT